jgi:RNA polymerase sigma-70 factor (ECF subfamily)
MRTEKENKFLEMIRLHKGLILKVCSLYVGKREETADLYQEIILNLWRSFEGFRGESKLSTWIYKVSLNTAIMDLRNRKKNPMVSMDGLFEPGETPDYDAPEDFRILHSAIRQLPEIERAIILLWLEELPGAEIARITGFSEGNIRVKVSRIKIKLKDLLLKQGYQIA